MRFSLRALVVFRSTCPFHDFRAAGTSTCALHSATSGCPGCAWARLLQHCSSKRATAQPKTRVRNSLRSQWGFLVDICSPLILSRAAECLRLRHSLGEALFLGLLPFLPLCQSPEPLHSFSERRPRCLQHWGLWISEDIAGGCISVKKCQKPWPGCNHLLFKLFSPVFL